MRNILLFCARYDKIVFFVWTQLTFISQEADIIIVMEEQK